MNVLQNALHELALVVPFYRNSAMLRRHVEEWNLYPAALKIICVDDGSPEPALPIVEQAASADLRQHMQLYRIGVDIPWNREGARNLGAHQATTEWIVHVDIDHVLPADAASALLRFSPDPRRWYRFERWRKGKADETRRKDQIPDESEYGQIHPHVDSYLVRRKIYWKTGGYDEDYAGCLGGGNMFLRRLGRMQVVAMLPLPIRLEVYTRSEIEDANDWSLSRDTTEASARRKMKEANGNGTPKNPLRFPWTRQL